MLARRRRPVGAAAATRLRGMRPPRTTSFPSGHTATAFGFAMGAGQELSALAFPLLAMASLVGFSRVHTGLHYPSDVVSGALIGVGVGLVGRQIGADGGDLCRKRHREPARLFDPWSMLGRFGDRHGARRSDGKFRGRQAIAATRRTSAAPTAVPAQPMPCPAPAACTGWATPTEERSSASRSTGKGLARWPASRWATTVRGRLRRQPFDAVDHADRHQPTGRPTSQGPHRSPRAPPATPSPAEHGRLPRWARCS
ncbi:MAG: phosphatase PAP2 family protein [Acidimicrobiales bacterium]